MNRRYRIVVVYHGHSWYVECMIFCTVAFLTKPHMFLLVPYPEALILWGFSVFIVAHEPNHTICVPPKPHMMAHLVYYPC